MTQEEEIREGLEWEAERNRRLRYHRKAAIQDAIRKNRMEIAITVAVLIGFIVFMIAWNLTQPMRERTAYIEGRYGVDHATAVAMAERGMGLTAAELLKEVR